MRRLFVVLSALVLLLLVLSLPQAQAQQPAAPSGTQAAPGSAFTYHGRLSGPSGPANGSLELVFRLYDAATDGTLLSAPLTQTVTLDNGLFSTQLDFGQTVFTGEARWLEIAVGDTTLNPRQALTPAPYALALPGLYTQQTAGTPNIIGGWSGNSVTAGVVGATISGGGNPTAAVGTGPNRVTDAYGTVSGGVNNQVGDNAGSPFDTYYATVGGGVSNTASGAYATVGGGGSNTARGTGSTVGGGINNTASGGNATVGGGYFNSASGYWATVGGGYFNTAAGDYSFVVGRRAKANHHGAFVWGDSTNADIASTANNQFIVRASGGTTFYSNAGMTSGVNLPSGGGAWNTLSDRNLKANIAAINPRSILEAVAAMPIARWNYVSQDASVQHIGPMAQDFYAAFGVGEDERRISTVDADGVALASIQGLYQLLQEKDAEMEALHREVAALKAGAPALPTWLLALIAGAALAVIGAAATCTVVVLGRSRKEAV